ncbi:MAG: tetratricopeptide repeat protein [Cyanobacteria bacterium P01_F01_bin.13]
MLIGISTCIVVALTAAFFPLGLPILGIILVAISWRNFLKQCEHKARIEADMYSALNKGVTYAGQGDYPNAIKAFDIALDRPPRTLNRFPHIAETYYNRGGVHYLMGNLFDALQDYDQAIDHKPKYVDALINRGPVHAEQGNYQAALADYQTAMQLMSDLSPDLSIVYHNSGNAYEALGDAENAIESYSQAIRLNPRYIDAYTAQGLLYIKLQNYTQAIKHMSHVIQLQQENAGESPGLARLEAKREHVFYHRGNAYFQKGDYADAIKDYTQVIQLNPEVISAYEYRGIAHCYLGNNQNALDDFSHVANSDPSGNTHYNHAIIQSLMGMKKEALASVNEALNLDENVIPAYYFRWNLRYDLDNQQIDLEDLQRAEALEMEKINVIYEYDAHGFYQRGLARLRRGNRQGAITDMEKVIQVCQNLQYFTFYQKAEQTLLEIQDST